MVLLLFCCLSRSGSVAKAPPLNINKVSSSLLSFGRKLIAPAMSGVSSNVAPINSEVFSSSSSYSSPPLVPPASAPSPALSHPLAEPPDQPQSQNYRMMKSESMPVHLSKGELIENRGAFLFMHFTFVVFFVFIYKTKVLSACPP